MIFRRCFGYFGYFASGLCGPKAKFGPKNLDQKQRNKWRRVEAKCETLLLAQSPITRESDCPQMRIHADDEFHCTEDSYINRVRGERFKDDDKTESRSFASNCETG